MEDVMIFALLCIAHLLGDFSFQPAALAENKKAQPRFLLLHACIYALSFAIVCFTFLSFQSLPLSYGIIVLSHLMIDWAKTKIEKSPRGTGALVSFLIDQALHIGIIFMVYKVFGLEKQTNGVFERCCTWQYFHEVVIYAVMYLSILNPTAVFIRKLFTCIDKNLEQTAEDRNPRIGGIIGKLERIIISTLVLCGQFGAIGFVLTAKSIARFRQLEDQTFAEKYLVGTLTSTAIALIAAIVVKKLL